MSITIASRKSKGRNLQKWIAKKISDITGIPWGKDELIASREMGQSGTDIRLLGEALKLFPWAVESKAQEKVSIHAWIEQAKQNKTENTDWLLVCKRSREKPIVIMDADVFFDLYQKLIWYKQNK